MNNPKFLSAYLSYYLPLHSVESSWIWAQVKKRLPAGQPLKHWMDVGCGPGTATLGLLSSVDEKPASVHLVDLSARALKVAEQLVRQASPGTQIKTTSTRLEALRPRQPMDLIVASHVLNEMGSGPRVRDKKMRAIETLFEQGSEHSLLLLIEPAKRESTLDLMWIRDQLTDVHPILAPCPHGTRFCPMIRAKAGWCYAEVPQGVTWPKDWKEALGRIGIEKAAAPFAYLVLQKTARNQNLSSHKVALTDTSQTRGLYCTGRQLQSGPRVPHRGAIIETAKSSETGSRQSTRKSSTGER